MNELQIAIIRAAQSIVDRGYHPSVKAIRVEVARKLGARTPGLNFLNHMRQDLLAAGLFPLAGGTAKPANRMPVRKDVEPTHRPDRYRSPFARKAIPIGQATRRATRTHVRGKAG